MQAQITINPNDVTLSRSLFDRTGSLDYYKQHLMGRKDVGMVQAFHSKFGFLGNVFFYTDSSYHNELHITFDNDSEKNDFMQRIKNEWAKVPADFIQKHEVFFKELPSKLKG